MPPAASLQSAPERAKHPVTASAWRLMTCRHQHKHGTVHMRLETSWLHRTSPSATKSAPRSVLASVLCLSCPPGSSGWESGHPVKARNSPRCHFRDPSLRHVTAAKTRQNSEPSPRQRRHAPCWHEAVEAGTDLSMVVSAWPLGRDSQSLGARTEISDVSCAPENVESPASA